MSNIYYTPINSVFPIEGTVLEILKINKNSQNILPGDLVKVESNNEQVIFCKAYQ